MKTGNNTRELAVGVDVGGTHITAAVVDIHARTVIPGSEVRAGLDPHAPADDILQIWFGAIQQAVQQAQEFVTKVGFAMPGPFDYEKGISLIRNMHKYDALYGLNIKELLAAHLDIDPDGIRLRNDTEAFLAGELMSGAAAGYNNAIGITLGTGLGSARSSNGVTEDVNLGSSSFKDGIAEDYLSTRWFVKRYHEYTGATISGVKELMELQEKKNAAAPLIWEEFCTNLAEFLQAFIKAEAPQVLVIGGNIAHAWQMFYPQVSRQLQPIAAQVAIKRAVLSESAALIGAVSTWMQTPVFTYNL